MKNLLKLTLIVVCTFFVTYMVSAQTVGQGAWMVGGSAGFRVEKAKNADDSESTINLSPNLGYFIADDLALGLLVSLESFSPAGDGESVTYFSVGPFVRYYFTNPIFAQAGVTLGLGDNEFTSFQVGVGYSWFLNNGVAIEPMLFFRTFGVDLPDDIGDSTTFGLSIGIQAFAHHEHGME